MTVFRGCSSALTLKRVVCALVLSFQASGCALMPAAAPTVSEIQDANRSPTANFEVVDIDDGVVATLARIRPEGFARQFRSKPQPADLRISVGDTLAINVIEE